MSLVEEKMVPETGYPDERSLLAAATLRGPYVLPSGDVIDEYFDVFRLCSDPILLARAARQLCALVPPRTEVLAGIAFGGIPVAVAMSISMQIPLALLRPASKPYGAQRQLEGADVTGRSVAVVDDTIRTGAQILKNVQDLRSRGAEVDYALSILDRGLGAEDMLRHHRVECRSLIRWPRKPAPSV